MCIGQKIIFKMWSKVKRKRELWVTDKIWPMQTKRSSLGKSNLY